MWYEKLHHILVDMGVFTSKANPCVWMRKAKDKQNNHYEYIGVYPEDLAIASEDCKSIVDSLRAKYGLKPKGDSPMIFHLGCNYLKDPDCALVASPKHHISIVHEAYVKMFSEEPVQRNTPMEKNDHPEIDNSELVDSKETELYMSMVGHLLWLITLGRFDIKSADVSLAMLRLAPCKDHVEGAKGTYGYITKSKSYSILYMTSKPDYSFLPNHEYEWARSVYGKAEDVLDPSAPDPFGKSVLPTSGVNANLYHCQATGRVLTTCLHSINNTPSDWYSKKQNTVETTIYDSEFVDIKFAKAQITVHYWIKSGRSLADLLYKHWNYTSVMEALVNFLDRCGKIVLSPKDAFYQYKRGVIGFHESLVLSW